MSNNSVAFFDIGETLGAVVTDASGQLLRLEVFSYVVPVLQQLRADGVTLGVISNTGSESAANVDRMLGDLHAYFAPELRIYSSVVGLKKDSPAIFELAMGRAARIMGGAISTAIFVGESRAERTLAMAAGMRAAEHPMLARSILAGGRTVYLRMRIALADAQRISVTFDATGVVPLRRTAVGNEIEILAVATDLAFPLLQAAGVTVEVLPGPGNAVGEDLYLLRDTPKRPELSAFTSAGGSIGIRSVVDTEGGLIVALAPHQTIDDFHVSSGHGHNLKLLADPALLQSQPGPMNYAAAALGDAELSPEELITLTETITEQNFEQTLRFVTGMDGRPGAVGINRHVLSPQMRAVTDGLTAEFERIGEGVFNVSGHRFEITGRDIRDAGGSRVANRIELFNVIAELPGESDEAILVTAHLDSTAAGTFHESYDPTVHEAPGVDDDGSGVAAVLLAARFMRRIFAGRKPARTVRFVLFNAEEQGLIGSERYARAQAARNARIAAVFQMDMIAYNSSQPNIFEVHAGYAGHPGVEDASFAVAYHVNQMGLHLAAAERSILAPAQLHRSPDPADGYSDHSSFQRRGYAGCAISEDFFPSPGNAADGNPHYHMVSDRVFDLPFATSLARVVAAAALRAAHPIEAARSDRIAATLAAGISAKAATADTVSVSGHIIVESRHEGVPAPAGIIVRSSHPEGSIAVSSAELDEAGRFVVDVPPGVFHLVVTDANNRALASTHDVPFEVESGRTIELQLAISPSPSMAWSEPANRRSALFSGMTLNATAASETTPEQVFDLAREIINPKPAAPFAGEFRADGLAASRSPGVGDDPRLTLCSTERLRKIDQLAELQGYADPAIVKLKIRHILSMGESGFASRIYTTPNFTIQYQTSGPAAVADDPSAFEVIEPGSNPPRVLATIPANSAPAYVRRVGFWLERSLAFYTSAPFSMRNPAANGRLSVVVNSDPFGGANPDAFYINNELPADLVCAVAVHELFHMVQFVYGLDRDEQWRDAIMEGGATFAEDTVADLMNRYLDEAGENFNGIGLLANPNQSLFAQAARYKSSLFWRYLAEQRSRLVDEPTIGVDTYRRVIEECAQNGCTTESIKRAIRSLTFDAELCAFSYEQGSTDVPASTETAFGNFALACYLKQLPGGTDSRFTFRENKERIYIDDVLRGIDPSLPSTEDLVEVKCEKNRLIEGGPKVIFQNRVRPLASCYYELEIAADIASIDLDFSAASGFSGLVQLVEMDGNQTVRDIMRSDKRVYRRRISNQSGETRLSRLAVIVSGGEAGGDFRVSLQSAAPFADVMITRWNSASRKEYHFDPHGAAWSWVSPDLWFEPDAAGDLSVKVRIHNKGNKPAEQVRCDVAYRAGAASGAGGPWLPILDTNGVVQRIAAQTLAPGEAREFILGWKPAQTSADAIFTLRAEVGCTDDANFDNNTAYSRLGITQLVAGGIGAAAFPQAMLATAAQGRVETFSRLRTSEPLTLGIGSPAIAMRATPMRALEFVPKPAAASLHGADVAPDRMPGYCAACSAITMRARAADGSLASGATMFFAEEVITASGSASLSGGTQTATANPVGSPFADTVLGRPATGLLALMFWGIDRHEAIAAAAEELLSPKANEEIRRIMAPLGEGQSFSGLAGWADGVKRRKPTPTDDADTRAFLEDPRNEDNDVWHYVNLPSRAEKYDRTAYPKFTRANDVVQMLAESVRVLSGTSVRFSELNALRLVIHLVGDVHQPVHVGCAYIDESGNVAKLIHDPDQADGLQSDRGGGRLLLPASMSLHGYWDSRLGSVNADGGHDHEFTSPGLKQHFVQKLRALTASLPEHQAELLQDSPDRWGEKWATESLIAAREAYHSLRIVGQKDNRGNFKVSWEGKTQYDERCGPIANDRLAAAVKRLAALLNAIFG